jgi:hypothetical protein
VASRGIFESIVAAIAFAQEYAEQSIDPEALLSAQVNLCDGDLGRGRDLLQTVHDPFYGPNADGLFFLDQGAESIIHSCLVLPGRQM